jgi:hypothetical protein
MENENCGGMSLKNLGGAGKEKVAKGPVYHARHTYRHPADKTLVWAGKGKKPILARRVGE